MTLSDCKKEELKWIINRLMEKYDYFNRDIVLRRILRELKYQKEIADLEEADRYSKLAHEKRMEYIKMMEPYEGKRLIDIPEAVLKKAAKVVKEAEEADAMWEKLSGFSRGGRKC